MRWKTQKGRLKTPFRFFTEAAFSDDLLFLTLIQKKLLLLRLLHNLNRTVIVAVVAVLVVQAAVDDVVGVIAVRYGFMAATFAVNVAFAGIDGMAAVGIGFIDA